MRRVLFLASLLTVFANAGCVTTSMQGYADRDPPARPLQHIVAYVSAPNSLSSTIQSDIVDEARGRGIVAEDALLLFPPTRSYSNAEVQQGLLNGGVDAILIVNVGDTGAVRQYAGTIFQSQSYGNYSGSGTVTSFGTMSTVSMNGTSRGTTTASATPIYRYSRQINFAARLVDAKSSRTLWVGNGQVQAGGSLFVGDGTSAKNTISAIFKDL